MPIAAQRSGRSKSLCAKRVRTFSAINICPQIFVCSVMCQFIFLFCVCNRCTVHISHPECTWIVSKYKCVSVKYLNERKHSSHAIFNNFKLKMINLNNQKLHFLSFIYVLTHFDAFRSHTFACVVTTVLVTVACLRVARLWKAI